LVLVIVLAGLGIRVWYAAEALRVDRFVDEKYSLLNIRAIVTEGTLVPASSYYPSPFFNVPPAALVAGSQALYGRTGNPVFEAVKADGFGPPTYLLTRLVQSFYGALALWLTFLVGREVFSRQVGVVAALALAFMPWHIHASGYFKPDAQLVAMVLLAFYLSLRAIETPSWRRYLLAALGIALAMSTKMTGAVVAVPLVVGTLASDWRDRKRLGLLMFAGLASAAFFVLLNPYWRFYPTWLAGLERDYAMRAARLGMTRWQIPGRVGELVTDPYTLGPWLGVLGLVALGLLVVGQMIAGGRPQRERSWRWMFLSLPVVYTAAYAWKTAYFKDNNFLPLMPFFCLATGWALIELWQGAKAVWPALKSRWVEIAVGSALCLVLMPPGLTYTYRATTPTTLDRALAFLARGMRPPRGRVVLVEDIPVQTPVWEGRRRFGRGRSRIELIDNWETVRREDFELADGMVLRPGSLDPAGSAQPWRNEERRFSSTWFRSRGPTLVAVLHDWQRVGRSQVLPIRRCRPHKRCRSAELPTTLGGEERITLVVSLGFARGESVADVTSLRLGSLDVPLHLASRTERGAIFITGKVTPPRGATAIVFEARRELLRPGRFAIELHRWRRPTG